MPYLFTSKFYFTFVTSTMEVDNPAVDNACAIPAWLEVYAIPTTCTISQLLDTKMSPPEVDHSTNMTAFSPIFSREVPTDPQENLLIRQVPTLGHLYQLRDQAIEAIIGGHVSFLDWRYNNIPTPFFMITYWIRQARAVKERVLWMSAKEHLVHLAINAPSAETAQVARRALRTFDELGWDVSLRGVKVNYIITSVDMRSLLLPGMLGSIIMDGMIRRTHRRQSSLLTNTPEARRTEVRVLDTFDQLAYDDLQNPGVYETSGRFAQLRTLGHRVCSGEIEKIYLPVLVHGNHWALFLVNVVSREISYGDSFGNPPPSQFITMLQRWLGMHKLGFYDIGDDLPIARQPFDDSISCGIIVVNAINHAILGDALWTPAARQELRLGEYLDIVDDYLQYRAHVSIVPTNSCIYVE
jgi:hypothetical protein